SRRWLSRNCDGAASRSAMKRDPKASISELSQLIEDGIYKAAALSILDPDLFAQVERRALTLDEAYTQVEPTRPRTRVERITMLFNRMSITEQQTFLRMVAPSMDWQPDTGQAA